MSRTLMLAVGGASSSLQDRKDTIWEVCSRAAFYSKRKDLIYKEVNSAGPSLKQIEHDIRYYLEFDVYGSSLIYIGKSWGVYEGTKVLNKLTKDKTIHFRSLTCIFLDGHGPWWNLAWGRKGKETIPDVWRALADEPKFISISQFNRKPMGTMFHNADDVHDLTGVYLTVPDANGGTKRELADHFNCTYYEGFHRAVETAIQRTA